MLNTLNIPKWHSVYLEIAIFIKGYTLVSDIGTVSCVFQLNLKFTQTSSASTTKITATLKILLNNEIININIKIWNNFFFYCGKKIYFVIFTDLCYTVKTKTNTQLIWIWFYSYLSIKCAFNVKIIPKMYIKMKLIG